MKRKILFRILVFWFISTAGFSQEGGFYILRNGELSEKQNGNPDTIKPDEWIIRLYKCTGEGYWGIISGETAQEVLEELKKSQENEKKYCKWANLGSECLYGALCVFKPLGPIAVFRYKSRSEKVQNFYQEISESLEGIATSMSNYQIATNLLKGGVTPFSKIGETYQEYRRNILRAQENLAKLYKIGENIESASQSTIDKLVDESYEISEILEESDDKLYTILKNENLLKDDDTNTNSVGGSEIHYKGKEIENKASVVNNVIKNEHTYNKSWVSKCAIQITDIQYIAVVNSDFYSLEIRVLPHKSYSRKVYTDGNEYNSNDFPEKIYFNSIAERETFLNKILQGNKNIEIYRN